MKKLKLNVLSEGNLSKLEMNQVKGGTCCGCSCYYAGSGGSSTNDNGNANNASGLVSSKGQCEAFYSV